jgi:glucokinase
VLTHDVRAAARSEAIQVDVDERMRGTDVFVAIGTGIAAATTVAGVMDPGAHSRAGEIGHVRVSGGTRQCSCSRVGCLETVASASAISDRFKTLGGRSGTTAAEVAQLVVADDPRATRVWNEAIAALATVLANVALASDPARIVLGGGLAESGETLRAPLAEAISRELAPLAAPSVARASWGRLAGAVGAASMAVERSGEMVPWKSVSPMTALGGSR